MSQAICACMPLFVTPHPNPFFSGSIEAIQLKIECWFDIELVLDQCLFGINPTPNERRFAIEYALNQR